MKTKRNFLTRLYMRRLSYVTGWKLIQQNKEFRNGLFLQYLEEYRQPTTPPQHRQFSTLPQYRQLTSLPLYRQLDSITDHIIDFKKRPLTLGEYNPAGYGEAFAKTLIRKLEGIGCPGLGTAILKDFLNDGENHIIENRERKHSPAYYQAFTDYRKIKMYADDLIDNYLKTVIPTTKPAQDEGGETESNTDKIWFRVGLLFATGEIFKFYESNKVTLKDSYTLRSLERATGIKNSRSYISTSINNTPNTDKNIFASRKKMNAILNYCHENSINVSDYFQEKYDLLPRD